MKTVGRQEFIILITATILFFSNNWGVPIYILDEAKNAECAREMWEANEWVVPTYNYELRTDKPPLHYYFMKIGFSMFGVNAFGARFFSAIMGIGIVWLIFRFCRESLGRETAFLSSLASMASIHFVLEFHLAVPDPYLIFFFVLSLFSFYKSIEERSRIYLVLGFGAAALGMLSKGPVAPGLIGLIFLIYLLITKQFKGEVLKFIFNPLGILVFLAIGVPWFVAVGLATDGAWLEGFFIKHNMERFTSEMEGHGGFFLLIPLIMLVGMLPFSVFLPQAIAHAWKNPQKRFLLLQLISAITIAVFFSLSRTKLPNYPLPAYPAIAILLGAYLAQLSNLQKRGNRFSFFIYVIISLLLPIGVYFGIKGDRVISELGELSWLMAPISLGAILSLIAYFRNNLKTIILIKAASYMLSAILIFWIGFPMINQYNPIEKALPLVKDNEHLAYYYRMNRAFPFNLKSGVKNLSTPEEVEEHLSSFPNAKIITLARHIKELKGIDFKEVFRQKDLFENTTTIIIAVNGKRETGNEGR